MKKILALFIVLSLMVIPFSYSSENELNEKVSSGFEDFKNKPIASADNPEYIPTQYIEKDFEKEDYSESFSEHQMRNFYEDSKKYYNYHQGPSYEKRDKKEILFSLIFSKIGDDFKAEELLSYCPDSDKITDIVISKIKAKIPDIQSVCNELDSMAQHCEERIKEGCNTIGKISINSNNEEKQLESRAFSCPPNRESLLKICKIRLDEYNEKRQQNIEEVCKSKVEQQKEYCNKQSSFNCDKESYITKCVNSLSVSITPEAEKSPLTQEIIETTDSGSSEITGRATYEDIKSECNRRWDEEGSKYCTQSNCETDSLMQQCLQQQSSDVEDSRCKVEADYLFKQVQQSCSRIEQKINMCLEENKERCSNLRDSVANCKEVLTEQNLRTIIKEAAERECKFYLLKKEQGNATKFEVVLAINKDISEENMDKIKFLVSDLEEVLSLENIIIYKGIISPTDLGKLKSYNFILDVKLNPITKDEEKTEKRLSKKTEHIVRKLISLKDADDLDDESSYLIGEDADDLLELSDELEKLEQSDRSLFKKIRILLGLAKEQQQREAKLLEEQIKKLDLSIEKLNSLLNDIEDPIIKAALKTQIENLKSQRESLLELKEKKQKN